MYSSMETLVKVLLGHKVWKQAANHNIVFPQPQQYGWKFNEDGTHSVEWEAEEVVKQTPFHFLVRNATAQKDVDHGVDVEGKVNTVVLDVTAKSAQILREWY